MLSDKKVNSNVKEIVKLNILINFTNWNKPLHNNSVAGK